MKCRQRIAPAIVMPEPTTTFATLLNVVIERRLFVLAGLARLLIAPP